MSSASPFGGGTFAADFRPPPGLANRHVQTLLPRLLPLQALSQTAEQVELSDGDFLELAWAVPAPRSSSAPIFILFHGLEGSFDSPYARQLLHAAAGRGWRAVLMHFRGCGKRANRLPRAYHSGETGDARQVLTQIRERYPEAPIVAAGVSLGGNMLVKLVAEAPMSLSGAIAINAPLDLAASADALNRGGARLYQRYLLTELRRKVAGQLARQAMPLRLDVDDLNALDTFWAYDDAVTAPLHGFASASDYYQRASAGPLIDTLTTPTLILHAADDPFMPAELFQRLPCPASAVRIEIARHGGHVGYIEAHRGRLRSWLARRVLAQLEDWVPMANGSAIPTVADGQTEK
ncbi:hydrolase [Salinicola aestuarinus]|uniref:hydrolase n=1 Tax=Salinicola aestuarinus TaxID=1949082 RepID=UPI000DA1F364|nr:hydrolase [Salinicola aestuarinus]